MQVQFSVTTKHICLNYYDRPQVFFQSGARTHARKSYGPLQHEPTKTNINDNVWQYQQ